MTSPNPSERVTRTLNGNLEGPNFSNSDELVTIYVFPEGKAFRVHKEVACLYSPVLKAAFNSKFVEGQTQTYTLEGCDKAFQLIVQWMYRQSFTPPATKEEFDLILAKDRSLRTTQDSEIQLKMLRYPGELIAAWLEADYLQMPRLQNYLVDQMEQWRSDFNASSAIWIDFLYENVPHGTAIRELVFEQSVRFVSERWYSYKKFPELFPKEFLLDHIIWYKRGIFNIAQPDPFTDRAEFKRRFHVPEERNDTLSKENV